MITTFTLYKGENLILQYDQCDGGAPRLYLGTKEPNSPWFFMDMESAQSLRDALNKGIEIMHNSKSEFDK